MIDLLRIFFPLESAKIFDYAKRADPAEPTLRKNLFTSDITL